MLCCMFGGTGNREHAVFPKCSRNMFRNHSGKTHRCTFSRSLFRGHEPRVRQFAAKQNYANLVAKLARRETCRS